MQPETIEKILSRLFKAEKILILTHVRPDGDALGSAFGMRSWLRGQGAAAEVFLSDLPPKCYRDICTGALTGDDFPGYDAFDTVLILDCADDSRISAPAMQTPPRAKSICIDHHFMTSVSAEYSFADHRYSSTCEMCAALAMHHSKQISPDCATLFYLGMMTDTGCFKFSNTNGRVMRMAADLLECGVALEKLINAVYFSVPLNQLQLQADIVNNCLETFFDGRFVCTYVSDELLQKHDFDLKESENIIDIIRSIDSAVIAAMIYRKGDSFKISLRSKDSAYPIIDIARHFGGGGHPLAGGCSITAENAGEARDLLLSEVQKLFNR